uniref:Ig-like domain-containing protein n=1 Tax=Oryzias latipes TaxID=8090 RepID=A0A3P9HHA8_ORYLA
MKKEKPVFLSQLSPSSVMSGETAQLTVRVAGFPKPIVQWFHNGRAIKSSSVYRLIEEKEEYTLVITRVTSEYEGEYSCTATNRFGQMTCSTYLEVKKSDVSQAERWVEKMFQTRGGEVSFQYRAQGDPVPDVKWYRGAFQIQPSRNCIILTHPDGSGLISIKSVKQGDSGLYTCKATNQFGEATCSAELVVFREQEQVTVKIDSLEINIGGHAKFECETEDAPNVTFKWYKSSVEIRHSEKYRILSRPTSSSLEVVKPVKADSGEYTCKASNQHGTDSCTATLIVTGKIQLTMLCFYSLCLHVC